MERLIILTGAVLLLAACATTPDGADRALAERDHEACAAHGLAFPDGPYVDCRYDLAERRHQRDWQNLQLTRMPRLDQGPDRPVEAYRPLSRAGFSCVRIEGDNGSWVACGPQR